MGKVRVDLGEPTLAEAIKLRFNFLDSEAKRLLAESNLDANEVYDNDDHLMRVAEGYYLLSEAYKVSRLGHKVDDAHWTEEPKKAALTTLSIMTFRPMRYLNPNAPNPGQVQCPSQSNACNDVFWLSAGARFAWLGRLGTKAEIVQPA